MNSVSRSTRLHVLTQSFDTKILPAASCLDAGRRIKDNGRPVDTYRDRKSYALGQNKNGTKMTSLQSPVEDGLHSP